MNLLYSTVCALIKIICRTLYGHRVYGLEHICSGAAIIAPNHSSFLDPPLIAISWPKVVSFLARKTLFSSPILGAVIKRLNAYPVSGTVQDLSSMKLICKLLKEGHQVVIFPSGVRSSDGSIGSVKSGIAMLAFRCDVPIIPVYIHGTFDIWSKEQRYPHLHGLTACVIGTPIYPDHFASLKKKEGQEAMGEEVRGALEKLRAWYENGAHGAPP